MKRLTRRQMLRGAAPLVATAPLARLAFPNAAGAGGMGLQDASHGSMAVGSAAMVGRQVPAVGGPNDLESLLIPPAALPHQPGRVRDYRLSAVDRQIEIFPGLTYAAWTYNGTVPGPVIRATEPGSTAFCVRVLSGVGGRMTS